jgi:hypothetical protein
LSRHSATSPINRRVLARRRGHKHPAVAATKLLKKPTAPDLWRRGGSQGTKRRRKVVGTPGGDEKSAINPPQGPRRPDRCGARTRAGTQCQWPPIHGRKRCRLHGGLSPGAPPGRRNGNYRNGQWTKAATEERRWLQTLVRSFARPRDGINEPE